MPVDGRRERVMAVVFASRLWLLDKGSVIMVRVMDNVVPDGR
jgi:hypothetical protein